MYNKMDIVLMHKNISVAEFSIDSESGTIISKLNIINEQHLPIPVKYNLGNEFAAVNALQNWVAYRSIPASRSNFDNFLAKCGVSTPSAAAYKSLGLNLSDQYWYKPQSMAIDWRDVNLFQNEFLKQNFQVSTMLNGSIISPDSNSNGELPKYWYIQNGKRLLYKQGSVPVFQQPYNEVFASRLLEKLAIPHVLYKIEYADDMAYSVCETFVDTQTEYIPAWDIIKIIKKSNSDNDYQHFFKCAQLLNIPLARQDIDNMLVFDYIINNIDRHYGNFGFIRNADTLEYLGMAPIFDNGNSLWYNVVDMEMSTQKQPAKPFKEKQDNQLKLAAHANMDLSVLTRDFIQKSVADVFKESARISPIRIRNLAYNVNKNIQSVSKYLQQAEQKIYM